ncbi:hypothetical protein [Pantoea cypripedii]|uniref:Inner membrane protein yidI n=1 Tax=Pantoea cypripedii TaxID=55209 RepID=A0A6B9G793_PANCY|nr:hypothetical protein [Pantoea cypripedii]QGY32552.1 hypothetical protein CUN67_26700 [Pantoea cypripedii]
MNTVFQNKWSSAGILLGVLALALTLFHFTAGPFDPPTPNLENRIAEKVSAMMTGIIAGIKGEEPPIITKKTTLTIDNILKNVGIGMAVIGMMCAFTAAITGEKTGCVSVAMICSVSTLAFYAVLLWMGLLLALVILFLVVSIFAGQPA